MGTEQSNIIACFVKGDKTNDQAGAGWTVYRENILLKKEESLRLGRRNTALQAESIAVDRIALYLLKDKYETDKIIIYADNQTVLQALDRLMIKTKVCTSTFDSLHRLGEKINETLYWIQVGTSGYEAVQTKKSNSIIRGSGPVFDTDCGPGSPILLEN